MSVIGKTNVYIVPQGSVKCLSFDGVDDRLEIADSPSLHADTYFTVTAWACIRKLPPIDYDHVPIVWRGNNIGWGVDYHFRIAILSTGGVTWGSGGQNGTEYYFDCGNIADKLNQMVFYTYVANGNTLKAYLNATQVATRSAVAPYRVAGYKTYLGWANRNGVNVYTDGIIGEVRIYNRALSDTEITTLYNGGDVWNGLVLYLPGYGILEDQNKWWDFSGNNSHGSLINGPKVVWNRIR